MRVSGYLKLPFLACACFLSSSPAPAWPVLLSVRRRNLGSQNRIWELAMTVRIDFALTPQVIECLGN